MDRTIRWRQNAVRRTCFEQDLRPVFLLGLGIGSGPAAIRKRRSITDTSAKNSDAGRETTIPQPLW
jgi:hypothetical protein